MKMGRRDLELAMVQLNTPFDQHISDEDLIQLILETEYNGVMQLHQPVKDSTSVQKVCLHIFYFSISSCVILAALIVALQFKLQNRPYCSNGIEKFGCKTCPTFAICSGGTAECEHGMLLFDGFCLEDGVESVKTAEILKLLLYRLEQAAGDYRCSYSSRNYLTIDDLLAIAASSNYTDSIEVLRVIDRLKAEHSVITHGRGETTTLVSTHFQRSVVCSFKLYLFENMKFLFGIVIVALGLFWYQKLVKRKRQIDLETKLISQSIIKSIVNENITTITETELCRRFISMCPQNDTTWNSILAKMKSHPRVKTAQIDGEIVYYISSQATYKV